MVIKNSRVILKISAIFCISYLLPIFDYAQENREIKLNAVVIEHKIKNPQKVIKIIASDFVKRYSPQNEISRVTEYRAVKANGSFIDFKTGKGFYLSKKYDPKSKSGKAPLLCFIDRYASLSYASNGEDVLEPEYIADKYPLGYNNIMGYLTADIISIIVQFSPLNTEYYKYFEYFFTNEIGKIHFKSFEDQIPQKCKIRAEGDIYYNINNFSVERIIFNRLEPYIIGQTGNYIHSNYALVEFGNSRSINIKSLYYNRQWGEVINKPGALRWIFHPTRRNPQKYNLQEYYLLKLDPAVYCMDNNMLVSEYKTLKRREDLDSLFNKLSFYCLRYENCTYTPYLWRDILDAETGEFPLKQAIEELNKKAKIEDQVARYLNYEPTMEDYNRLSVFYDGGYDKYIPNYQTFISYYKQIHKKMQYVFEK